MIVKREVKENLQAITTVHILFDCSCSLIGGMTCCCRGTIGSSMVECILDCDQLPRGLLGIVLPSCRCVVAPV